MVVVDDDEPLAALLLHALETRGYRTRWLKDGQEAADLLGIPYEQYMQAGLIPVAHTKGLDFKPGPRKPLDRIVHWDRW